jgi:hypothetical protein
MKTTKTLSQDDWSLFRYLNPGTPEYETGVNQDVRFSPRKSLKIYIFFIFKVSLYLVVSIIFVDIPSSLVMSLAVPYIALIMHVSSLKLCRISTVSFGNPLTYAASIVSTH